MRAMMLGAALVAMAAAAPGRQKRDVNVVVETVTDVVYVTEIVTVTATDDPVPISSTPIPVSSTSVSIPTIPSIPSIASSSADYAPTPINHVVNSPVEPIYSSVATPSSVLGYTVVSSPTSIAAPPPPPTSIVQTSISIIPSTSAIPIVSTPVSIRPPPSIPVSLPPVSISTPPVSVSSASPPSSSNVEAGIPIPTDYASTVVAHHNLHRRNHSAVDIVWDGPLADTASSIAGNCVYKHNTTANRDAIGGYGQNIAAGIASNNISVIITELFYNGEVGWYQGLYGQQQPDMTNFEHWGHFSQIVWGSTTKVGCATVYCPKGLANVDANVPPYMTVCNYQAPGNIAADYTEVGSPLGLPTAHWDYFE